VPTPLSVRNAVRRLRVDDVVGQGVGGVARDRLAEIVKVLCRHLWMANVVKQRPITRISTWLRCT
jgi:hypothetical protein